MTNASTTVKIVVSMVVAAALVATRLSSSESSTGLKGTRNLQFGGIAVSSATTDGAANSIGSLQPGLFLGAPQIGANGQGLTQGTSFGTSSTNSPGFGNSVSQGAANGAGNATSLVVGGNTQGGLNTNSGGPGIALPEAIFGNGFADFGASGGGIGTFGSPILIPGTGSPAIPGVAASSGGGGKKGKSKDGGDTNIAAVAAVAAVAPVVIGALQTGGGGGGFGFTLGGGVGNVTNVNQGYTQAYGTAQTSGFGSGQGSSLFGNAGGNGGGTSAGNGGGALKPVVGASADTGMPPTPPTSSNFITTTLFNGTGGGLASGGAGGYVGFNPNTPVLFGNFPLGP